MPVPFESLLPYGIMLGVRVRSTVTVSKMLIDLQMMMVSGVGLTYIKTSQNGGKWPRHNIDRWDKVCVSTTASISMLTYCFSKVSINSARSDHSIFKRLTTRSDGTRQKVNWILQRSIWSGYRPGWVRVEQPLEGTNFDSNSRTQHMLTNTQLESRIRWFWQAIKYTLWL